MTAITVDETGPDWWDGREPPTATRYYAQRGEGDYAFGPTERAAFDALLEKERKLQYDRP